MWSVQITRLVESVQRPRGEAEPDGSDRRAHVSYLREDRCDGVPTDAAAEDADACKGRVIAPRPALLLTL